jgi:hypothetical protein
MNVTITTRTKSDTAPDINLIRNYLDSLGLDLISVNTYIGYSSDDAWSD